MMPSRMPPSMAPGTEPIPAIDADAHERRGGFILADGPHGLAHTGAVDEEGKHHHDERGDQQGKDGDTIDGDAADGDLAQLHNGGIGLLLGTEKDQGEVLQKVADTDGSDEHAEGRRLAQRLIGQKFDEDAEQRTDKDAEQHGDEGRQAHLRNGDDAGVSADHDDIAVGKVQHLGDAVHHGVAQRDEGVNAAQTESAD